MGLPSIEHFDISFICRTSENLENYRGKYEFTMLLNSLLGLIIVPNERKATRDFSFDFWSKKLTDFAEVRNIFTKQNEKVLKKNKEIEQRKFLWLSKTNQERNLNDITIGEFITRMRHSIAHFGIIPLAKPESKTEWCGVILKNFREDILSDQTKKLTKNFEICLMENEIRDLSGFISGKYRETVKSGRGENQK